MQIVASQLTEDQITGKVFGQKIRFWEPFMLLMNNPRADDFNSNVKYK